MKLGDLFIRIDSLCVPCLVFAFQFARVNQDEMKSRKKCVVNAKLAMSEGLCVIVDRCNFDFSQRQVWYDLAVEYGYPVDCVVLVVPLPLCIQRCRQRKTHETIQPKAAPKIVNMVKAQWKMPSREEQLQYLRNFKVLQSSQQFNDALVLNLNQK
jgi:predicted kinase